MIFRNEFFFLSNFFPCRVADPDYPELVYGSVEAAFQAQKCTERQSRLPFTAMGPAQAKRYGRTVPLRPDWEEMKIPVMKKLLAAKFSEPGLAARLRAIEQPIIEENTWGDTFWGVCRGRGRNMLGKLLTEVKAEL